VPVVVVIDTLNRGLAGDENKGDDMAKFIRAADAIRAAFGSAVLIVHHCGIQGSRPRGHTSLSGADDAQIAIERDSAGNVMATVEHMKDGEAGAVIVSRLVPIRVGTDDDGEPIMSCVVVEAPAVPAVKNAGKSAGKTTPNQRRFLDILCTAILEAPDDLKNTTTVPNGVQAVTRDMLKKYCVAKGWMEEAESNRAEVQRHAECPCRQEPYRPHKHARLDALMTTNRRHRRHFPQALPAPLGSASAGTQAPQGVSIRNPAALRPARSLHNDLPSRKEWERLFVGFTVTAASLARPAVAYPVRSTKASGAAAYGFVGGSGRTK
jgi:hypothetical protein